MALAVLADTALSTAIRTIRLSDERLGTTYLQVQLTGAPAEGETYACGVSCGSRVGTNLTQSFATGTLHARGEAICRVSGEFAHLAPPADTTLRPLPWQRMERRVEMLCEGALAPPERKILANCENELARSHQTDHFLRCFWCGRTKRDMLGTYQEIEMGPHLGNRVGEVQGGIMLGIAATVECDVAPSQMRLANASMWYARPGRGASLVVRSKIIHAGESTALIHTNVLTNDQRVAAVAITQHVAAPITINS